MPCFYTGSAAGDERLAAENSARENQKIITKLTAMLCATINGLDHPHLARLPGDVKKWWKEHQEIDRKRG